MCLSLFCYALLCVHSSYAIILERKRKLAAFAIIVLQMYCYCKYLWLFLIVPWLGLQYMIVVYFLIILTNFCVSVSCYHKLVCHSDILRSDQLSLSIVVGSNSVENQEARFNRISNLDYL